MQISESLSVRTDSVTPRLKGVLKHLNESRWKRGAAGVNDKSN